MLEDPFRFTTAQELEMAVRLVLAGVFGAAIGWERDMAEKPAGLRTLSLVSMGAALFSLISQFGFPVTEGFRDPSRVAAQIVTGIGFLGAGTILISGARVRGLTTAASIWVTASIGMAVGSGMYIISVVGTVLSLIVLRVLPRGR